MIDIHYINKEEVPGLGSELLVFWLLSVVENERFKCGDVNVIFCSDDYLLGVNKQYLHHDYYTDIITFDYGDGNTISGDLFISLDRVFDNAVAYNDAVLVELRRVCVHGILHLCGYGDKTEDQIRVMRSKESFYLKTYVSRET
jgi:probable rRNA maturation factor